MRERIIISLAVLIFSLAGFAEEPPATVTFNVKNMDVVEVLKLLSEQGNFNLSVSAGVRGRVTLFLKDLDVGEALDIVLVSSNLAFQRRGKVIYVMSDKEYELKYGSKYGDERVMHTFNLKHAKATRIAEMISQIISKVGKVVIDEAINTIVVIDIPQNLAEVATIIDKLDESLGTKIFELNYLAVEDAQEKITEMLTKDVGILKADFSSRKVIVTDYPEKLKEMAEVIAAFDVMPLQVLIEAKIVEIKPSEKFYSGVNWEYWLEKYFQVEGDFTIPSPSGTTDNVSFGTVGIDDPDAINEYSGVIDFLDIFGEINIISSPRIMTINNQEAKILVGTKDAYITSTVAQVGESAVTSQTVNYVDIGIKLYVTPTINRDGYITLYIKPEVTSSEREKIIAEDKETEIPIVTTSEAETYVVVKDGATVIIGGLKKITIERESKQVPVLGSIPLIGTFFKSKKDVRQEHELVILLTPRIISADQSLPEKDKAYLDN